MTVLHYTRYTVRIDVHGRVAQSVTFLATDACLTADPGVEGWFLKSDSTSKANILNDQFVSEDTSSLPDKGPSPYPSMPDIEVNWKGVHKLLKGLKPFKATGPDSNPAFILKAAADELARILARIYQTQLDNGQVPSDWRDAWIAPVFKKGDKHKAANYRPVSLTSITCKLLEHIIHSNVIAHFDKHHI